MNCLNRLLSILETAKTGARGAKVKAEATARAKSIFKINSRIKIREKGDGEPMFLIRAFEEIFISSSSANLANIKF